MSDPFKLIIEDDEGKRSVVPVELGEVSIGRHDGNTIRLNERNVSRNHARIFRENGSIFAEDLESYNGVFINGDRIAGRSELHEGDLLQIGDFHLELRGEGLQRRSEETTQKTLVPDLESTQPEIRVPADASALAASEAPPPAAAAPVPAPAPAPEPEPEQRAEPTAIIRLDHLEDLESQKQPAGAIAGEKPRLICVSTNLAGNEYNVGKTEVTIGRTEDNDIQIDHRSVSKKHAKLVVGVGSYKIIDLKSANGTLVNGEQYAQLSLKSGDLIELGHVKFRFVPPGEVCNLTQDEQTAIQIAQGGAPPTPLTTAPTAPVPAPAEAPTQTFAAAAKSNPLIAVAAGGVLLLVVLVAVLIISGEDDEGPKTSPGTEVAELETEPDGAALAGAGAADKLVASAKRYMAKRKFDKALKRIDMALDKDPVHDEAIDLKDSVEDELEAQEAFEEAQTAFKARQWDDAWNALNEIPEVSVFAADASRMRTDARGAMVGERADRARQMIVAKDWSGAQGVIDEIRGLGDETRANEVMTELGSARSAEKTKVAASSPSRRPSPKPRPRPEPKKPEPKKPEPKKPEPKPKPTPAPGKSLSAKELYVAGTKLLNSKPQEAIEKFSKCVQVDRKFCLCYRAMGIAYARSGNGPKAARYYRLYLKYCPTAKDAKQVKKLLEAYGG